MFAHRQQSPVLTEYVGDIKLAGWKRDLNPTWKKLMILVDVGEPTSLLDHVYLGCTQRECKSNESIFLTNPEKMFE